MTAHTEFGFFWPVFNTAALPLVEYCLNTNTHGRKT